MTTTVFYIDRQNDAENVATYLEGRSFRYTKSSFEEAFKAGDSIVAMVAAGIIVRALAPLINDKWTDPPVCTCSVLICNMQFHCSVATMAPTSLLISCSRP